MATSRRNFLKGSLAAASLGCLAPNAASAAAAADARQNEVAFHRRVPVRQDVDVFVAGGVREEIQDADLYAFQFFSK